MNNANLSKAPICIIVVFYIFIASLSINIVAECLCPQTLGGIYLTRRKPVPYQQSCHAEKEIIANLRIDSIWTKNTTPQYVKYTILSKAVVDTSIFENSDLDSVTNLLSYDTSGFSINFIDSLGNTSNLTIGDTLRDVFVLQGICSGNGIFWNISQKKCCFLNESNPPFPLKSALSTFNNYLNSNNFYKGELAPVGDLKIGPIFNLDFNGELGWQLTAYNDLANWYFIKYTGSSGCGALGCETYQTNTYRISQSGAIDQIACESDLPERCATHTLLDNRANNIKLPLSMNFIVYDLAGRRIAKINSIRPTDLQKIIANLHLKNKLYILQSEDNKETTQLYRNFY
jgi:hypothetical protein